ncbi:hypothetical protein KDK95_27535 [Actinospica sp. MGRD01-02]|uniref:Carboxypeptidase regulatory-like domain-containing protein n=1 Tax=Actinospica acidithermotolerans TaxID=2828514 RepID=A0A941EEN1_9ACTN|nr:hypothetical protein [Actinospica acidithermotolerans]MBR7830086.1 hypothetical protein [Actinospica acidithermotolerans]
MSTSDGYEGAEHENVRLLADLNALYQYDDPVPESVLDAARGAFAWLDFDSELAKLLDEESLAGRAVRATGDQHLLTFEAEHLTFVVEATELADGRKLVGQVMPAGPREVWLESAGGERAATEVDELGRFSLPQLPAGPARLRCELPDGTRVVTEWGAI